jgi:hypothetical protein
MEQWGAEVVSYDLSPDYSWDVVPFYDTDHRQRTRTMKLWIERVNNAYWLCHGAFKSRARVVYGTIYDIPGEIGMVDIAAVCSVLLHVRDPFLALQNACKLVKDTVIVTDAVPEHLMKDKPSQIIFRPGLRLTHNPIDSHATWWYLSPEIIVDFLGVLDFEETWVTHHKQLWGKKDSPYIEIPFYTVVAHRRQPGDRVV